MIKVRLGQVDATLHDGQWSCAHAPTRGVLTSLSSLDPVGVSKGDPDFALVRQLQSRLKSLQIVELPPEEPEGELTVY